ncbi:MAG: tRNA pseudouridine(38-40) synthase TruA [Clostridia bacterium]|nr:tRNA pseudouridine(38-40) synthase TruA [Clostridia bacterium]
MKLLIKIAYDGTDYCGWQFQPNVRTVQAQVTAAAKKIFGFDCDVTGCSRTDSGVHAKGFHATVTQKGKDNIECSIPLEKLPKAFNAHLPDDIAVLGARYVSDEFHARYSVVSKKYIYKMHIGCERSPFDRHGALHITSKFVEDYLDRMNDAAAHFVGTHDFTSFMAQGSKIEDATRTVLNASVTVSPNDPDILLFEVEADGFLYNMVRIMVGTLLEVAEGKLSTDGIDGIIAAKDRKKAGRTVPPHGLYLECVNYPDNI